MNFPFIYSNTPAAPAYIIYISLLIRYSRACGSYQDFLDRGLLLTRKLLNQWFLLVKLKSSPRKSYGRHHDDLVERYGISVKILPRICSTCRKHFPVLSSFMTYHRVCNYINTTGATSGAGTTYPSGHPSSPSVFIGVGVTQSLVLCVCFVDRRCLSFCTFFWALCCLFFFDIRILIAPLVTSNSSCTQLPEMIWYRLYLITWFYQLTIQIYTCT